MTQNILHCRIHNVQELTAHRSPQVNLLTINQFIDADP